MATKNRWSAKVSTDSTHPEEGLFNKGPATIARSLASKKVSPKGPASGMRMLNFYINRAGKNLPRERKTTLRRAKSLLSEIIADQKEKTTVRKTPKKTAAKNTSRKSASNKTAKKSTKKAAKKSTKKTHSRS